MTILLYKEWEEIKEGRAGNVPATIETLQIRFRELVEIRNMIPSKKKKK
jgi:hypothetical protein